MISVTFWSEAQKAGSFTGGRSTQPLKQAASRAASLTASALSNNMTNDGKSANGCRPTTRSPRGQNKGIMGRQFVYLERAGRQSLQGQTKKWRHISNLANGNLPHSIMFVCSMPKCSICTLYLLLPSYHYIPKELIMGLFISNLLEWYDMSDMWLTSVG